jgi:hypothetical protein
MSLVIVENPGEQLLTDEVIHEADQRVLPCLQARNATWQCSLLAIDRQRMICTFDAPDAESVRDSYRKAGFPSRTIWAGELIKLTNSTPSHSTMRCVIEGTYPPLSKTDWDEISHKMQHCCAEHEMEWLQSYISRDRTKVIYELIASNIQLVQEASHKLGITCDRIWSAEALKP